MYPNEQCYTSDWAMHESLMWQRKEGRKEGRKEEGVPACLRLRGPNLKASSIILYCAATDLFIPLCDDGRTDAETPPDNKLCLAVAERETWRL